MAKDAITLLDHLGWRKAHVFGHSMGSMIACKLATMGPDRVLSLVLLNMICFSFSPKHILPFAISQVLFLQISDHLLLVHTRM
ncbi:unnamed protein product [Lathyrus sativus]|nr:unnamed protein product [Lathyrus sativus]